LRRGDLEMALRVRGDQGWKWYDGVAKLAGLA
jgi:hypothetical protein